MNREERDGTGWESIRHDFCDIVTDYWKNNKNHSKRLSKELPPQVTCKEKYGRIDVMMYSGCDEVVNGFCTYIEMLSEMKCVECGERGEARDTGRVKTLCDECYLDCKKK